MDHNLTHRIRERAYEIWAANGCRDGEADRHWLAAEREILTIAPARAPAAAKRPSAKKAARSTLGAATKAAAIRIG